MTAINSFQFKPGDLLADKYEVLQLLGAGWEGEVYRVRERATGIDRAVKFFFPSRGSIAKRIRWYAKKLHKLRTCQMLIQYQTQDTLWFKGRPIPFLVSEYVDGRLLSEFIRGKSGNRLTPYEGLHLLYALAKGIESIHHLHEYHGDLHTDNVIVCRRGLQFDLKLLDLYHWEAPRTENVQDDVCNLVRIFYDVLGGQRTYQKHPQWVKDICCGLKRSLILKKFRTAGQLRKYLEYIEI